MPLSQTFDVVIVGGGLAGAAIGGVLARGGLGVLIVEREAQFRDRVRGEFTWPWGVTEITRLGLQGVLLSAGAVPLTHTQVYEQQHLVKCDPAPLPGMMGFSHPAFQEALFAWAAAQGAMTQRPAKAVHYTSGTPSRLTVLRGSQQIDYRARLVIGADGKHSAARRWTSGDSMIDEEHHRFGGVAMAGLPGIWDVIADGSSFAVGCLWAARGREGARVYLRMGADELRRTSVDRNFAAFVTTAGAYMPPGTLEGAQQAGPCAFFPNSCTWATHVAGNGVTLVGDAAGSVDPSWGRGTSLLFKDVRELGERLLSSARWDRAIADYATRRAQYFDVLRAYDRWTNLHAAEDGPAAERRRESRNRAKEFDPTLGGFKLIELQGPDGLVANEAARRHYFGEDLQASGPGSPSHHRHAGAVAESRRADQAHSPRRAPAV